METMVTQAAYKPLPSLELIPDLSNKSAVKSKNGPATLPLGSGMCNVSPAYLCHEVFWLFYISAWPHAHCRSQVRAVCYQNLFFMNLREILWGVLVQLTMAVVLMSARWFPIGEFFLFHLSSQVQQSPNKQPPPRGSRHSWNLISYPTLRPQLLLPQQLSVIFE